MTKEEYENMSVCLIKMRRYEKLQKELQDIDAILYQRLQPKSMQFTAFDSFESREINLTHRANATLMTFICEVRQKIIDEMDGV